MLKFWCYRTLCSLILLVMSATASADWLKIDDPASTLAEKFIDTTAIRQSGPMNTMRRVWEISNLVKGSANKVLSVKQQIEYDCKDRRRRVVEESSFSEHWAKGENLILAEPDAKPGDWNDIGIASVNETIFNRVCPSG